MPTTSTFPLTLDSDSNLIRRVGTDFLIPDDHNNIVDSVEAVEAVLGAIGDGSESGGTKGVLCTLADYAGLVTTGFPSARKHFASDVAQAFYALAGALPASWYLGPGVVADFTHPRGLCRLTIPANSGQLIAATTLPYASPLVAIAKFAMAQTPATPAVRVGIAIGDAPANFDCWNLTSNYGSMWLAGTHRADGLSTGIVNSYLGQPHGQLLVHDDGSNVEFRHSYDGVVWSQALTSHARAGDCTRFIFQSYGSIAFTQYLYIDWVVFGNVLPPDCP